MKRKYDVAASLGHVRDLPKSQMGVDVDDGFKPRYINIRGKGEVIKKLREMARTAPAVYLATDPDREGEAISWHLCQVLGIQPSEARRVTFHEITEEAVTEAFKHPRPIDQNLVDAQQARRILDRLVGYSLSPLLWHKVKKGLSAGRVQSAALRLVCQREKEIDEFQREEYWTLDAKLESAGGEVFLARYYGTEGKKVDLRSRADADEIIASVKDEPFIVKSVEQKEKRRYAPFPFTTSTLQQEASRHLGFSVKRTMAVAQTLYEGVNLGKEGPRGLITYMRTDSTRVSEASGAQARALILEKFGREYIGPVRQAKEGPGVQGAHEAIRPTDVSRTPESLKQDLSQDQYKLYSLIWKRFVASQMAPAVYDTISAEIEAGRHLFKAGGQRLKFDGFTRVYTERTDDPEKDTPPLPPLREGEVLILRDLLPAQHFTEPPPRYTEASLVKAMEERGIGRPSTYAPTISVLLERDYVRKEKKKLVPTELGRMVDKLLVENFPSVLDLDFTREMEEKLDKIEAGEGHWQSVVREFWEPFKALVDKAEESLGRQELPEEPAGVNCDVCGKPMVIRTGRFGKFIACSGYPECKNTKPFLDKIGVPCPKCGGDLVRRRSKKGREFFSCVNYPTCDFLSWSRPVGRNCPVCGEPLVEGPGNAVRCSRKGCDYREKAAGGKSFPAPETPKEDAANSLEN